MYTLHHSDKLLNPEVLNIRGKESEYYLFIDIFDKAANEIPETYIDFDSAMNFVDDIVFGNAKGEVLFKGYNIEGNQIEITFTRGDEKFSIGGHLAEEGCDDE